LTASNRHKVGGVRFVAKGLNQKTVTITKSPSGKGKFLLVSHSVCEEAMKSLSGNGFKMWVFFMENSDGAKVSPSNKAVKDRTGLGKYSYDSAMHELANKGYLIHADGGKKTDWIFSDIPCRPLTYKANQEGLKSEETKLLKSAESSTFKSAENQTFKSAKNEQDNRIINRITDNISLYPSQSFIASEHKEELREIALESGLSVPEAEIDRFCEYYQNEPLHNPRKAFLSWLESPECKRRMREAESAENDLRRFEFF